MEEAAEHGLSEREVNQMKQAIQKHKQIFKIRLVSDGPAHISPMTITLDPTKKPVIVKARKYPNEERKFLDKYILTLSKMGFIKACLQAHRKAAPHLVRKASKFLFRTTIDL